MATGGETFITETGAGEIDYNALSDGIGELETLVSGVTQTSQSTLLLKKRKEMREVDDALEFMKEEFAARMQACEERQRDFERKQGEMKDNVARFEKFIQENDTKLKRAQMKSVTERRACEECEKQIKALTLELDKLKAKRDQSRVDVERFQKYRTYLEKTVEESEDAYPEPEDIVNRHNTLVGAHEDLQAQVQNGAREMDVLRTELQTLQRATQNEVLVMTSDIDSKNKQLEQCRSLLTDLDSQREAAESKMNRATTDMGQVDQSIKNLYGRCVQSMADRRSQAKPPKLDNSGSLTEAERAKRKLNYLADHLKIVGERLTDLITINAEYSRWAEKHRYAGSVTANGSLASASTASLSIVSHGASTAVLSRR